MIPITEFLAKAREWQKQNTDWQLYCDMELCSEFPSGNAMTCFQTRRPI